MQKSSLNTIPQKKYEDLLGVIANSRFEIGNKQDEIVLYCCVNEQNNHQRQ